MRTLLIIMTWLLVAAGRTAAVPCPSLSPPSNVAASDGLYTDKVRVTWTAVSGATLYEVWRHHTSNTAQATRVADAVTDSLFDDTTVTPGAITFYWAKAVNDCGTTSEFSLSNIGHRLLSPPPGLTASDGASIHTVAITWNISPGAEYYRVYRGTSDDCTCAETIGGWLQTTSYNDDSAVPGVTYYYWVVAAISSAGTRASEMGTANTGWRALDCNNNSVPDQTEPDSDGDAVIDVCDNCPESANPSQADYDEDGLGDACDTLRITAAASIATHTGVGEFGVNFWPPGTSTESRLANPLSIRVTFDHPVQGSGAAGSVLASDVRCSAGTLSQVQQSSSTRITMQIAGLPPAVRLAIGFPGLQSVAGPNHQTVCGVVVLGDVSGDRTVNIFDLVMLRNVLNQQTTSSNYRFDIDANGSINLFDMVRVRNGLNTLSVTNCP